MNADQTPARRSLRAYALCILATSCDLGMGKEPHIHERVGPHEIEVAGSDTTTVAIVFELDSSRTITADVVVAIEGVVIDRGPPDDISMQLDCDHGSASDPSTVLAGRPVEVEASSVAAPTEIECTLTFVPRDPLAAPVFVQWLTSVEVDYGWSDRDAGLDVHVDVMAPEP